MPPVWTRALAVVSLVVLSGCFLSDVSLDGKACPCVAPYTCDLARNVCVLDGFDDGGSDDGDAATGFDDAAALDGEEAESGIGKADANWPDAEEMDAIDEPADLGVEADSGVPPDAGVPADSGAPRDTGVPADVGIPADAGIPADTGLIDTGLVDTGLVDTGIPDAGQPDAGLFPLGTDCTLNGQCESAFCLSVNTSSTATQSFCSTPCAATSDCPLDLSCLNVNWMGFCLREAVFPSATFNVASGGMCTMANNQCQSTICDTANTSCIERCTRESDCATFGGNCWTWPNSATTIVNICFPQAGAATGAACTQNASCISGVCDRASARCASHCCTDAECPAAETCAIYDILATIPVKICRTRLTNGTGTLGQTCTANADCESELCIAQNPNGTGQRRCSTHCCESTDCALLPAGGRCWPVNGPISGTWAGVCLPN